MPTALAAYYIWWQPIFVKLTSFMGNNFVNLTSEGFEKFLSQKESPRLGGGLSEDIMKIKGIGQKTLMSQCNTLATTVPKPANVFTQR